MMRRYLIGVDGGGTKTDILITDRAENIIWQGETSAGGNVSIRPMINIVSEIWETIEKGLAEIGARKEEVRGIGMGISGLNSEKQRAEFTDLWQRKNESAIETKIANDTLIALLSAGSEAGKEKVVIVQIIGTGMNCYGRGQDGLEVKSGGVDYVGDQGSGFEIGYQALRAAVAAEDGREKPTQLGKLIREGYSFSHWSDLIALLCPNDQGWKKEVIAKIGELCVRAGITYPDDEVIEEIIVKAVTDAFIAIAAVAKKLEIKKEEEFDLVWVGGMIKHRPNYREKLTALTKNYFPNVKIWLPEEPPVIGAIRLIVQNDAADPDSLEARDQIVQS